MKPLLLTLTFLCGASLALLAQDNKILTFAEAKAQADQGDAFAEAVVAFHYTLGWQTEKNLELAVQYAKSSAEKKNPFGLFRLGALTLAGEGVEKNEKEGLELQDESLVGLNEMEGNPYSITALGVALFQGKVLDQDQETAAKLYKKAADLGYAPAQYNYAKCAESGQGIAKNLVVSKSYLQKAAAQNFPPALSGKTESANKVEAPEAAGTYQALDAELNAVYKELRALLDPANQKKLKDWQMKWVQKNAIAIKKASSPADKARLLLEPTQTRLVELEALLAEIKDYAERELDFEDNASIRYLGAQDSDALLTRDFPEDSMRLTCGITLAPGIFYKWKDIKRMSPELAYLSTNTNKKLLAYKLNEPEGNMLMLEGFTLSFPYYLSPDGSFAIVESSQDPMFQPDGADLKSLYYVYALPRFDDVPRNTPLGSELKKIELKPIKSLTESQLAEAYPEAAVPKAENTPSVESQDKATDNVGEPIPSEVPDAEAVSIPREFVGTWDSRPMSEESQIVIKEKEFHFYLGECVGKFTKITRSGPNEVECEMICREIEDTWKDKRTLKLVAGGKQLIINNADKPLYKAK
jgi:TPR repeat protein